MKHPFIKLAVAAGIAAAVFFAAKKTKETLEKLKERAEAEAENAEETVVQDSPSNTESEEAE